MFKNWPSVRLGLLCPHFYCAVVNVFSKRIKPHETFPGMDVFNMKDLYRLNLAKEPGVPEVDENTNTVDQETTTNVTEEETISDEEDMDSDVSQEEYMPATRLRNREFNFEEEYSEYYDINLNYKAQLVRHGTIHFPENWDIYYCQRGKFKRFPSPKADASGLLSKLLDSLFVYLYAYVFVI